MKNYPTLTSLILEGQKEKAAEAYLSKMVRSSPFKGKVFVVGGYVRDEMLGRDAKDIDLVVELPDGGIKFAEWITKKLRIYKKDSNPILYPKFGTAKFNLRGITYKGQDLSDLDIEVVMTRTEEYTKGSRKPKVKAGTLKQDVERRDATINTLLNDLTTGEILDLTGQGKRDLEKGVIRTPLDPNIIFSEDPLRMLRAIRFTVKYGWDLPMFMIRAIKVNASKIVSISNERIRDELDKMLVTDRPKQAIRLMKITGLLRHILPEVDDLVGLTQNKHHDRDAFSHSLNVLSRVSPVLTKRLGALLHDVGKRATKTVENDDIHFYAHEKVGEDLTRQILSRLKYPNDMIDRIAVAVGQHMRLKKSGQQGELVTDKALRKLQRDLGDHLEDLLDLMDADNKSHAKDSRLDDQIASIRNRLLGINVVKPVGDKLPITGNDLIKLGLKPGPAFKRLLDMVQDAVDENPHLTRQQAIDIVKSNIEEK